jgi:uncharacterized membrane protein YtjA (UPF0391 family)
MLYWALLFFIVAIIAGVFGFGGISAAASGIAKLLFILFLVMFAASLIIYAVRGSAPLPVSRRTRAGLAGRAPIRPRTSRSSSALFPRARRRGGHWRRPEPRRRGRVFRADAEPWRGARSCSGRSF